MPRGPFQGTWRAGVRPTVVTAPDGIVYLNGQPDLIACGDCRRSFDINKYITSVQVDLNVDNAPGSASINLSIPRHTIDDFMVEGEPIVAPMMEVEIYAKGYYLVEGLPQYYPIFWGLVTEVSDSYSGGEHTFSINCADILKWWELCRMNVNPSFTQPAGQLGKDYITGNVFHGANVYDIIWTLAQQSFGDVVHATGSLTSLIKEKQQRDTFARALGDMMGYWNQRFSQVRSNMLLYGTSGAAVRGDVLYEYQANKNSKGVSKFASAAVRKANGGDNSSQMLFSPESVQPFRSSLSNSGNPNLWQSEFQTKLEIANACKEAVGFEFYMDVTGDIVFKPPFYNLDILSNKPVSWLQDIDIIDWDFSESEAEVVTHLQMQGSYEGGAMDMGITSDFNTPFTQVIDYHLLRKYGWRSQSYSAEYLSSTFDMFWSGVDILDRMNSRRHRATVNIPLRPELRLGFPIYVAPKDQVWYVQGISHNIQFGGRAQTTLTLTAKRGKFLAPRGIGSLELVSHRKDPASKNQEQTEPLTNNSKPSSKELSNTSSFKLKVGDAAETPPEITSNFLGLADPYAPLMLRHPKTGRLVGYPNVVMAFLKPYQPDPKSAKRALGQNTSNKRTAKKIRSKDSKEAQEKNLQDVVKTISQTVERNLADKHLNNRHTFGLTSAGTYTYVHDTSNVIEELLLIQASKIQLEGAAPDALGKTAVMRPVSDSRGFELVGQFKYGRGVSLRDGALVLSNPEGESNKATVATQLALSGGLLESLEAQSAGITAQTSAYANPASTIATLQPEDLQTAGTISPETGLPEFVPTQTNFVDSAPLSSIENNGTTVNVEATQLSRALTLAEMRIKDGSPSEFKACPCLTGRSDLAFINTGYQVKTLTGTADDNTTLRPTLTGTGSNLQTEINVISARLDNEILTPAEREALGLQKFRLESTLFKVESGDEVSTAAYTVPSQEMSAKVDLFLANLYAALDEPHQQFEKEIRGGYLPSTSRAAALGEPGVGPPQSPLSPPFSAIGRASGGDPEALALQGSQALNGIVEAWQDFGNNLQKNPKRAALESEIRQLEKKLADLGVEEERLTERNPETGALVPDNNIESFPSTSSRVNSLRSERERLEKQLSNVKGKLNLLNNS